MPHKPGVLGLGSPNLAPGRNRCLLDASSRRCRVTSRLLKGQRGKNKFMKNHHTFLGRKVRAGLSVVAVAASLGLASSGTGATFSYLGAAGDYAVFGVGGS